MSKTHGMSGHPLYKVWGDMKGRCLNEAYPKYPCYGGRGITVCYTWSNDVMSFIRWAKENGWKPGLQIDRVNNDGNYEPDNCRFVTIKENRRNSRQTKLSVEDVVEIKKALAEGVIHKDLALKYGVAKNTITCINTGVSWSDIRIGEVVK